MFEFSLEVKGKLDSKELWSLLEPLDVNLIDLGDGVFVYGRLNPTRLAQAICICGKYGKVKGDFSSSEE